MKTTTITSTLATAAVVLTAACAPAATAAPAFSIEVASRHATDLCWHDYHGWADGYAFRHKHMMKFHWNAAHDRRITRKFGGGRVIFDGTRVWNGTDARILMSGVCEHPEKRWSSVPDKDAFAH